MAVLYFLLLAEDVGTTYSKYLWSPFAWAHDIFWLPLPGIKVRPFDLVMVGILIVAAARRTSRAPLVTPMRNALFLSAATVVAWFAYGLARGGDARAGSWQIYLLLTTVLVAFTFAATFQTVEHYALLAKILVAAGFYRAMMCWIFYFDYVSPHKLDPLPDFITTHDDSVLWVGVIIVLIVNALEKRARGTTIRTVVGILFVLGAIQWNQRRLAWVSLIMALVTMFFLLPPGKTRRRVSRFALFAAPVITLYVAIGWGRGERIFLPLRSLETVTTTEDLSTKARNVENFGAHCDRSHRHSRRHGLGAPLHRVLEQIQHRRVLRALAIRPSQQHSRAARVHGRARIHRLLAGVSDGRLPQCPHGKAREHHRGAQRGYRGRGADDHLRQRNVRRHGALLAEDDVHLGGELRAGAAFADRGRGVAGFQIAAIFPGKMSGDGQCQS